MTAASKEEMMSWFILRRTMVLLGSVLILSSVIHSASAADFSKDVAAAATRVGQDLAGAKRTTVAVVDFTDLAGNASELGRFLAEELSVALIGSAPGVEVIDRAHLAALIREHRLAADGLIDPATARKLGQIAGVQALVTGTLTPFGDSIRVTLKVLDSTTARVLSASVFELARTNTINDLLGRKASDSLPSSPPAGTVSNGSERAIAVTTPVRPETKPPKPSVTDRVGGLVAALQSCTRDRSTVICEGTLTNARAQGVMFELNQNQSYAVDNFGNRGGLSRLSFGSRVGSVNLEPQVPIRFSLFFNGGFGEATGMTVVLAVPKYVLGPGMGGPDGEKMTFRNVPLDVP